MDDTDLISTARTAAKQYQERGELTLYILLTMLADRLASVVGEY